MPQQSQIERRNSKELKAPDLPAAPRVLAVEEVSKLLNELGAENFHVRERASEKLVKAGPQVIGQVIGALRDPRNEVSVRGLRVLERFARDNPDALLPHLKQIAAVENRVIESRLGDFGKTLVGAMVRQIEQEPTNRFIAKCMSTTPTTGRALTHLQMELTSDFNKSNVKRHFVEICTRAKERCDAITSPKNEIRLNMIRLQRIGIKPDEGIGRGILYGIGLAKQLGSERLKNLSIGVLEGLENYFESQMESSKDPIGSLKKVADRGQKISNEFEELARTYANGTNGNFETVDKILGFSSAEFNKQLKDALAADNPQKLDKFIDKIECRKVFTFQIGTLMQSGFDPMHPGRGTNILRAAKSVVNKGDFEQFLAETLPSLQVIGELQNSGTTTAADKAKIYKLTDSSLKEPNALKRRSSLETAEALARLCSLGFEPGSKQLPRDIFNKVITAELETKDAERQARIFQLYASTMNFLADDLDNADARELGSLALRVLQTENLEEMKTVEQTAMELFSDLPPGEVS